MKLKRSVYQVIIITCLLFLVSCQSDKDNQALSCTQEKYRSTAETLMAKFKDIIQKSDIYNIEQRQELLLELMSIQNEITKIECKENFPEKQVSLENAVTEMINAVHFADAGESQEVTKAMFKSLLYESEFNNWPDTLVE